MKKLFLLLALLSSVFTACDSGLDNEENGGTPSTPKIELSQQSVEVEFESAEYEVTITSPYSWEATAKNDWIKVVTETGIAGTKTLKFSVARNEEEDIREGTIVVKNEDYNLVAELYITQGAFVPAITIEPESLVFTFEGGTQEVAITANFEYEYSTTADWLTIEKSEKGVNISATQNTKFEERTAEITISSEKYGVSKTIAVTQKGVSAEFQNVIIYTSSDDKVVTPYERNVFGADIVSNTYSNGQGVIIFDAPVTSIGDYAFYNCTSLASVTIPDSVTSIRGSAFINCDGLTRVNVNISDLARYCTSNPMHSIPGETHLYLNGKEITNLVIPNSVTSIGSYAFYGCDGLTSITIPNSVTSIGGYAFRGCTSLTSVTIPDSVTSIGSHAFASCTSLASVTIGNSVSSIGDSAFRNCDGLTNITIPNSVTSIGSCAFAWCKNLTAFYGEFASADNRCLVIDGVLNSFAPAGLTEYTIPDSVTSIGSYAFYGCDGLTSITISNSVTSIGSYAFAWCENLTSVYCKPTTPPTASVNTWGYWGAFSFNSSDRKIYVPTASVDAYKSASGWSEYASYIVGYDF